MRKAPILLLSAFALAASLQAEAQTAKHGYSGARSHVGTTRHFNGGHRHHGGHRHYYSGYRGWGYWGVPLAVGVGFGLGSWYGSPYYGSYWDSPRYYSVPTRVVYREEPRWVTYEPNPQLLPEREGEYRDAPPAEGAPTGRPLYQNYCEATRAYYPDVKTCSSGWILRAPRYN